MAKEAKEVRLFVEVSDLRKESDMDYGYDGAQLAEVRVLRKFKVKVDDDFKIIIPEAK